MKNTLLALCPALLLILSSCAGVRVTHTDVATGATDPRAIYIRPFDVTYTEFSGSHHSDGERAIRRSLAPIEFAHDLKEELEKIAPSMVLKDDERAHTGWLVEGQLEIVHAGQPALRALPGNLVGVGASKVVMHIRVIDLEAHRAGAIDVKDKDSGNVELNAMQTNRGTVIYQFDIAGGGKATGKFGSITAPGLGYAVPFDFRNAAEKIYLTLTPDPHGYGIRTSPAQR